MVEGINGHTALMEVATEAIAVLDATVQVQVATTDALLVLQEKFLNAQKNLQDQIAQIAAVGPGAG